MTGSSCSRHSRAAQLSVPFPPTTTIASSRCSDTVSSTRSTFPSLAYGWTRLMPMIVPPRGRIPDTCLGPSSISRPSIRPCQPSRMPTTSFPSASLRRTTARVTAFSPGQSPPPLRIPTRATSASWRIREGRLTERASHRRRRDHHDGDGTGAEVGGRDVVAEHQAEARARQPREVHRLRRDPLRLRPRRSAVRRGLLEDVDAAASGDIDAVVGDLLVGDRELSGGGRVCGQPGDEVVDRRRRRR